MKTRLSHIIKSGMAKMAVIAAAMVVMILAQSTGLSIVGGSASAAMINAPITVTSTADDSTPGTLRYAIVNAASGDTIAFDALVFNSPQTISLTMGELVVAQNVTINGPGAALLSVSGNHASGVFNIRSGATVTLSAMTIRDAGNVIQGGGIMNRGTATINDCVIRNNTAIQGGGLQNEGTMTINNSTIHSNQAEIYMGGGIANFGQMVVDNSLVANNNALLHKGGGIATGGSLIITNSTISGNASKNIFEYGGGIYFNSQQPSKVVNCTITNNRAHVGNGGGVYVNDGPVTLRNTIIALNFGYDGTTPNDIASSEIGVDASNSHSNLIGTGGAGGLTDGVNNNQVGVVDPLLAPLDNNGGPTLTHKLIANSPAINAGNNALAVDASNNPLTTDQRGVGFPRINGGAVDIGAFEAQVFFFLKPIENLPTINVANAGSSISIKFSLGDDHGLGIFAAGYPASTPNACDFSGSTNDITETVTAGNSSLSYDATTNTYTYVWKTSKMWENTCRQLILKMADGSEHRAHFRFR
jgi:hypothetical protein